MGREYRILLGFLGLLAGVFVGLLSKKLLVPRPPVGAGPDVDIHAAYGTPNEIVEPPRLSLRASAFAAAPPLVAAAPPAAPNAPPADPFVARPMRGDPPEEPIEAPRPASMFVRLPTADDPAPSPSDAGISGRYADEARADDEDLGPPATVAPRPFEPVEDARPLGAAPPVAPPPAAGVAAASFAVGPGAHVARAGDSWWSIAEAAYGDGRLYRAVFAWNRAVDPRVSLAAGTRLELPPLEKLRAAWPALVPSGP